VYNKLFAKIVDSTVWLQPTPTRIVWVTFLAVMDEDGFVALASIPNVARRAAVTLDEAAAAIASLEGPDPDSSDPAHEGRRIERVPGGWMVLNAEKYGDIVTRTVARERTRERVRRHRAKGVTVDLCAYCGASATGVDHVVPKQAGGTDDPGNLVSCCLRCNGHKASRSLADFVADKTLPYALDLPAIRANPKLRGHLADSCNATCNADVTPSDTYSESDTDREDVQASRSEALAVRPADRQDGAGGFDAFWQAYPRRTGKQAALAVWKRLRPDASLQARILQAVREQSGCEQWLKDGGQFIPHPRTWLSQGRWDDEPVQVPAMNEKTTKTLTAGARWLAKQKKEDG
jgi:hypothetical protein